MEKRSEEPKGQIKSIAAIRAELSACSYTDLPAFLAAYGADTRSGVRSLTQKAQNMLHRYEAELVRLEQMRVYERRYADSAACICGVDEAGRGPLAGPVVAGAVILPPDCTILYLNDSKKLSAGRREELFLKIQEEAIASAVGIVDADRIDAINILQATYEAMRQAIAGLDPAPDLLLNDAVTIPQMTIPQVPIVKGDAKSVSIAAASILAKVTRDRIMTAYDAQYPAYGFAQHKGYGSAAHIAALKQYGPCPIHRRSFIGHFV